MNARQKAKKYKNRINTLESDNDLMRRIIADTPAMQELYDVYNRPKYVTHTTMQFQEYIARRMFPVCTWDLDGSIDRAKQAVARDLLKEVKEKITYEVDDECLPPTITASIFIGKKENEDEHN